jgi:hypothetical protein
LQFGSIGWNIPYEFNPSHFAISRKHLKIFLGESTDGEVPFEALTYVIGESTDFASPTAGNAARLSDRHSVSGFETHIRNPEGHQREYD